MCWAQQTAMQYGIWEHGHLAGAVSLKEFDKAASCAQVSP